MLPITKMLSSKNMTSCSRAVKDCYIAIHYTSGSTSKAGAAKANAEYYNNNSLSASADFFVDDATIVQKNPDLSKWYSWAVGGKSYGNKGGSLYGVATNKNCISIELCSTNSAGKATTPNDPRYSFSSAVLQNARDLVQYLIKTYGISINKVIRHYDVNGKPCPGIVGWNLESGSESKWKDFKNSIIGISATPKPTTTVTTTVKPSTSTPASSTPATISTSFMVRTKTEMNVRKGPGTSYAITCVAAVGSYTIVETSGSWGKLKSGAGWINISTKYAERI